MNRLSITLIAAFVLSTGSAWAKLPTPVPTEEAKVAAEEKKTKAAEAAKKDTEDLAKAQDRVADKYIKEQKAKGIVVKPTPIAPSAPPPVAAAAPAAPAAKPPVAPPAAAVPAPAKK